ncbi:MAG: hypothetical protein M1826_004588 [Phylliscum demangeonii]|nr:MAG: hypothetical protein M1826_004588 [Phylliscum demangeonii]
MLTAVLLAALAALFIQPIRSVPLSSPAPAPALAYDLAFKQPECSLHIDFPDPSIIQVGDMWYAFATMGPGRNVQVATSHDFHHWDYLEQDALPQMPSWVHQIPQVWAPDVIPRADGRFALYFSAAPASAGDKHCVGAAVSSGTDPVGPYVANDTPFVCPLDQGGAIDAAGFRDGDQHFVVYKIDGNSMDGDGTTHPTPLMLQAVDPDGTTPCANTPPVALLDRDDNDGPLIEAPSLGRSPDGVYFLFFSSNAWNTDLYDISYATATDLHGPYTKSSTPLLTSGQIAGVSGPGGARVTPDLARVAFHAQLNGHDVNDGRSMWTSDLHVRGHSAMLHL